MPPIYFFSWNDKLIVLFGVFAITSFFYLSYSAVSEAIRALFCDNEDEYVSSGIPDGITNKLNYFFWYIFNVCSYCLGYWTAVFMLTMIALEKAIFLYPWFYQLILFVHILVGGLFITAVNSFIIIPIVKRIMNHE